MWGINMSDNKFNWKKALKIILLVGLIGAGIYVAVITAGVVMIFNSASDHTELIGEIHLPDKTFHVNEPIPLELLVPDDLEGIYDLMWDYQLEDSDEIGFEYLIEGVNLNDQFTDKELSTLFEKDVVNTSRCAVFTPETKGKYTINVAGFFKQTNPQGITSIEVIVNE